MRAAVIALVIAAICLVTAGVIRVKRQHEVLSLGYQLSRKSEDVRRLREVRRQLELEHATLASPDEHREAPDRQEHHPDRRAIVAEQAAQPEGGGHQHGEVDHVAEDGEGPAGEEAVAGSSRRTPSGDRIDGEAEQDQPERPPRAVIWKCAEYPSFATAPAALFATRLSKCGGLFGAVFGFIEGLKNLRAARVTRAPG